MWKLLQILTAACVVMLIRRPCHYDAIQHEFYQVWDSIEGLKTKEKKKGNHWLKSLIDFVSARMKKWIQQ